MDLKLIYIRPWYKDMLESVGVDKWMDKSGESEPEMVHLTV